MEWSCALVGGAGVGDGAAGGVAAACAEGEAGAEAGGAVPSDLQATSAAASESARARLGGTLLIMGLSRFLRGGRKWGRTIANGPAPSKRSRHGNHGAPHRHGGAGSRASTAPLSSAVRAAAC